MLHKEKSKTVSESRAELVDLILPPDTNMHGTIFGGKVMAYADKIAVISAMRHCRKPVVTARSDSFEFHAPIKSGEAICIESFVVCAFRTSMEVLVRIYAENLLTGEKRRTSQAFLTIIAIDEHSKPAEVPPIIPVTDEEKILYQSAKERYHSRKKAMAASII
ncbi:MAG: acyl-CoA thioesterase [Bacillus sp. (in: firmicutes)]